MKEMLTEIKLSRVDLYCEECAKKPNKGCRLKLIKSLFLRQATYEYQCPHCGKIYESLTQYPYLVDEPVNK